MTDARFCTYCHLPVPGWLNVGAGAAKETVYCCYGCRLAAAITGSQCSDGAPISLLTRLGIAVALSMAVMAFSLPLYSEDVYGLSDAPSSFSAGLIDLLQYASLLLSAGVFVLLGLPILSNAIDDLHRWIAGTDALVVLGVGATLVYSAYATVHGSTQTYYETACLVLVLFTLGRYLEALGRHRATTAMASMESLLPSEVEITRDGRSFTARMIDLRVGDRVHVPAGQTICVDGLVETGQAHVDERLISGESEPKFKQPGDLVRAGTIALDGGLTVAAAEVGPASTVGRLAALLDTARRSRGLYQRMADRLATVFLPLVIVLAIGTAVFHSVRGDARQGLLSGLAVLLISCPCALGIATPMAMWLALGKAARRGVLFVGGAAVEGLAKVRVVAFDKTGTLSDGEPQVAEFLTESTSAEENGHVLAVAAGLSRSSTHVLSRSIIRYAAGRGIEPSPTALAVPIDGAGLTGEVASCKVQLGSLKMMQATSAVFGNKLLSSSARIVERGHGLSCLSCDGRVIGMFAFAEQLRPEAREAVARLRKLDCRICVLTGDHRVRGAAIAQELGVETVADLAPEEKLTQVRRLRHESGRVAMVGDGLNDAPALAAADVGIAMGCGPDLTRRTADVCLLGNDLCTVPFAIQLARRTVRTVRSNLAWAFAYNLVAIPMAMIGTLRPVYAAVAMVVSSLIVVTNTLGLERPDRRESS